MDISHETALDDLIKDVLDHGCAVIEHRLVLRWFNRKNWGKAMWHSLQQRFTKELKERGEDKDGWRLYAISGNSHTLSLLCFNYENSEDADGWWKPVEKLI
jgi:uncharacterized protein YeaO (DUF488 family)